LICSAINGKAHGLDGKGPIEVDAPSCVDALIDFVYHMTLDRVTGIHGRELLVNAATTDTSTLTYNPKIEVDLETPHTATLCATVFDFTMKVYSNILARKRHRVLQAMEQSPRPTCFADEDDDEVAYVRSSS
jgi:hypothetical protein